MALSQARIRCMKSDYLINETEYYRLVHSDECAVTGYLILFAKPKAHSIMELPMPAVMELGQMLQQATAAISSVIKPQRIYCCSVGELMPQVHFHLFPRTQQLAEEYLANHPQDINGINGFQLLDWAKKTFVGTLDRQTLVSTIAELKSSYNNSVIAN